MTTIILDAPIGEENHNKVHTKLQKTQSDFTELAKKIREAGLLRKDVRFYIRKFTQIAFITIFLWVGVFLLANTAYALILAPFIGIMTAQFGFLAHEGAHKQIFETNKANERFALIVSNLIVGLSFGWWDKKKHNLHHANPNTVGKDPDINIHVLAFTKESFNKKKGIEKLLTKKQGMLFPFLLLFTGFDLLFESYKALLQPKTTINNRGLEITLLTVRTLLPFVFLFVLFNPFIAVGFWLIQMMFFGLFMGGAFAPNHKGMPIIPKDMKVDFFRKQVLTSRDIKSSWLIDNLMGGLNYQIEHHLFPSMPRPNLRAAQQIVKDYCDEKNVSYMETGLFRSYKIVMDYLSTVGLSEADPFECPMVNQFRRAD